MKLKVGFPTYLNALPFHLPLVSQLIPNSVECIYGIPSQLNKMLEEQTLDLALTSSVMALNQSYSFLPGYGIAATGEVLSVNLYTQCPLNQLTEIAVTHHSATSFSLLQLLCDQLWNIKPQFVPLDPQSPLKRYKAFLLIGDQALENPSIAGYETIDLSRTWYEWRAQPFVFALFAMRKKIQKSCISNLLTILDQALIWSQTNIKTIQAEAHKRSALPSSLLIHYYSLLQFRLGQKEMEGFNQFIQLIKGSNDLPKILSRNDSIDVCHHCATL